MPVVKRSVADKRAADPKYQELRKKLVSEWKGEMPAFADLGSAPEIIEEEAKPGLIESVYVVWEAWRDLDKQTRSELIVDAFREVKGEGKLAELMMAIGLTQSERARYSL